MTLQSHETTNKREDELGPQVYDIFGDQENHSSKLARNGDGQFG